MQSKQLTQFYQAYSDWLDIGAPDKKPFWRMFGLCANLSDMQFRFDIYDSVDREMQSQFAELGKTYGIPFNEDRVDYYKEKERAECYLNPKRIAWVKSHLNQGE